MRLSPDIAVMVAAAAGAACVLVLAGGDRASERLTRVTQPRAPVLTARAGAVLASSGDPAPAPASTRRLAAAALAAVAVVTFVGGLAGVVLGAIGGALCYLLLGRLEPRSVRERRERVAHDLPAAASLLAAAVSAGATPVAGLEVVAAAVDGPLGTDLQRLASRARLGGDLGAGWGSAGTDADASRLARVIARAVHTGAPLAAALDRLAADLHAERRFEIDRRARSVGVRAAAPLGVCFLPGFLLVGVVPVVAGIAGAVLGPVL